MRHKPAAKIRLVLLATAVPTLVAGLVARARAEPGEVSQVDSILDRLEKRLLDQEADGLTFGEKMPPPSTGNPADGLITKYKSKNGTRVEAAPVEADQLKAIAKLVTALESDVDQLASGVQRTKQGILDEAAIDAYVSLEANLADTDAAALKTLSVKLDGYPVYELSDASGLWMPSKSVPLYAGPLQPGVHRIDLEARLVMRHKQGLPLNSDVYRFINRTFDLSVRSGVTNNHYVIGITPPEKLDGSVDATLKEAP